MISKPVHRWLMLIAVLAASGGIWLMTTAKNEESAPFLVTIAAQPTNSRPGGEQPSSIPKSVPFPASTEVLAALHLPADSVLRGGVTSDSDDGVTCGEVASSQDARGFRRFVYIASAKTGFVDDGSQDFRRISATACAAR